jgi:hypothetical protein
MVFEAPCGSGEDVWRKAAADQLRISGIAFAFTLP